MAPEQLRMETADRRSDVYALGVMLWEMLTSRNLFRGRSVEDERDPRKSAASKSLCRSSRRARPRGAKGDRLAWLTVLSAGEVGAWFPRATANGLEVSASATYALGAHLFTRLSAAYRLVSFDFHTQPGDERVAGGATDQALTMAVAGGMTL